jgi:flagellar biosynthesis protein FlhG
MSDQADKLRELAQAPLPPVCDAAPGPPMIVVSGGKGGVGATTVAVNLGAVLADRGQRVVLVDAARDHADMAQVAGVGPIRGGTLADVLAGKCSASTALVPGPAGTLLLANHWAPKSTPNFSRHAQQRLLAELQSLRDEADLLVVDVGSGLTSWTRRFWLRARLVIAVTTTDDTAVMDTYAAIKLSVADRLAPDIRVLANQCDSDRAATEVAQRLTTASQRFLGRTVLHLPSLPRHLSDGFAGIKPEPRVWESPNSPFGHAVLWLGQAVNEVSHGWHALSPSEGRGRFSTPCAGGLGRATHVPAAALASGDHGALAPC